MTADCLSHQVRSLSFRLSGRQAKCGGGGGDGDSVQGECLDFLPTAAPPSAAESAEQRLLRQLKGLLDDGVITPEQFEAKREELLAR